jgi:hypothetical protein
MISIGFDCPPTPRDCLLPTAEAGLRNARECHPDISQCVPRTQAEGLGNMSLCFFRATDKDVSKTDGGIRIGEISIERQCMFTFGDALRSTLGPYVD